MVTESRVFWVADLDRPLGAQEGKGGGDAPGVEEGVVGVTIDGESETVRQVAARYRRAVETEMRRHRGPNVEATGEARWLRQAPKIAVLGDDITVRSPRGKCRVGNEGGESGEGVGEGNAISIDSGLCETGQIDDEIAEAWVEAGPDQSVDGTEFRESARHVQTHGADLKDLAAFARQGPVAFPEAGPTRPFQVIDDDGVAIEHTIRPSPETGVPVPGTRALELDGGAEDADREESGDIEEDPDADEEKDVGDRP